MQIDLLKRATGLKIVLLIPLLSALLLPSISRAHDIYFCGEKIPISNQEISTKLMNVIKKQIPNINISELRKRAKKYFPRIEHYLQAAGLPEDLKYLPIVESGFLNAQSDAGAKGVWQLMPATATEKGLQISGFTDDRDNLDKSTRAACYLLGEYYLSIKKQHNISSWVLTAAAYNIGINSMHKAIEKQGANFFSMHLNAETALYVYKIIAVKELFEFPEFYMKDFGYNIFYPGAAPSLLISNSTVDTLVFTKLNLQVAAKPESQVSKIEKNTYSFIGAAIKGKYKNFADRDLVSIELQENFDLKGSYRAKGSILKGTAWIIDDKIFIDLGYADHDVTIFDKNGNGGKAGTQGIPLSALKNNEPVLLKVLKEL